MNSSGCGGRYGNIYGSRYRGKCGGGYIWGGVYDRPSSDFYVLATKESRGSTTEIPLSPLPAWPHSLFPAHQQWSRGGDDGFDICRVVRSI